MAVTYDIKAHPTVYNGRRYRSRLEAKWAAFFDQLGWKHEYEPIDFGAWSPDFALIGAHGPIYVEVKPITSIDWDIARKIEGAWQGPALIVGLSPMREEDAWRSDHPILGWCNEIYLSDEYCCNWAPAMFGWYEHAPDSPDYTHMEGSYHGRISGEYDGGSWGGAKAKPHQIWTAWNRASNAVQWRSR